MSTKPTWDRSLLHDERDDLFPPVALRPRDEALADLAEQRERHHAADREISASRAMRSLAVASLVSVLVVPWVAGALFKSQISGGLALVIWLGALALALPAAVASIRAKTGTTPTAWSHTYAAVLSHDEYELFVERLANGQRAYAQLFFRIALMNASVVLAPLGAFQLVWFRRAIWEFSRSFRRFDRIVDRAWDENPDGAMVRSKPLWRMQNAARELYQKAQEQADNNGRGASVSKR